MNRWLFDHAMDCVVWIAEKINANQEYMAKEELWYEAGHSQALTIPANEGESLFDNFELKNISEANLLAENVVEENASIIHNTFATEFRQAKRKRDSGRHSSFHGSDSSGSEFDHTLVDLSAI